MSLRSRINRARDLALSVTAVTVAPLVGAVAGAVLLTGAMSVIAYFVFTMPANNDYQDFGAGGD